MSVVLPHPIFPAIAICILIDILGLDILVVLEVLDCCADLGFLEESVELCVDTVDDRGEVLWVMFEVDIISLDSEYGTFIFIIDKVFVVIVESFEVVDLYGLFVLSSSFLNLCDECRYRFSKVYHEVRDFGDGCHELEEFHVSLEVSVGEVSLLVVIESEDMNAFEYGSVLNDSVFCFIDIECVFESLFEEEHFECECPSFDVGIVVL